MKVRVVLVFLVGVFGAGSGLAEEEPEIRNWSAPPYWSPVAAPAEDQERGSMQKSFRIGTEAVTTSAPTPLPFVGITPCRMADTRSGSGFPAGYGPPSIAGGGTQRTFTITGRCGVPADAQAVSFNFAVWGPATRGDLRVFPAGAGTPLVSTLNWEAGILALANAAVVSLGSGGAVTVQVDGPGTVDIFFDVNGYYSPLGVVNSLNGLTGDINLAVGPNMSISHFNQTITISSSGGTITEVTAGTGLTGGGTSGSVTLGIQSLGVGTSQLADASVTDAKVASGISWGKLTGVPGFVLRAGDTMTGSLVLSPGSINLVTEPSTASSGNILKNGSPFLHDYGTANTFVGLNAGNFTTSGTGGNSAFGNAALNKITSGAFNTALGAGALNSNVAGGDNTAVGANALTALTYGSWSVAVGSRSGQFLQDGIYNTAVGIEALRNNLHGSYNSAFGAQALNSLTSGFRNVALGSASGSGLTSGSDNLYLGALVTPPVSNESGTIRIGERLFQTTTYIAGIRGVTPGASDVLPVVIDSHGQLGTVAGVPPGGPAGGGLSGTYPNPSVVSSSANTGLTIVSRDVGGGFSAGTVKLDGDLYLPATDAAGTAGAVILNDALFLHARGNWNTFLGTNAGNPGLSVGGAFFNTGVGYQALQSLTTGPFNVAVGAGALQANTSGTENTAVGNGALYANGTGGDNVGVGASALQNNSTGGGNTAVGASAMLTNLGGSFNAAVGEWALIWSKGDSNAAVGAYALMNLSFGNNNIAFGRDAGYNLTSGSSNIYLGNTGSASESSTIRIGSPQTATYIAGIYGAAIGGSALAVGVDSSGRLGTTVSSRRYKESIADVGDESDVLLKLRPVSFFYSADSRETRIRQYGLIAEEVAEVAPGLVVCDSEGRPETVRYHLVNAMLLNEVQKQRALIEELTRRLERLERGEARLPAGER